MLPVDRGRPLKVKPHRLPERIRHGIAVRRISVAERVIVKCPIVDVLFAQEFPQLLRRIPPIDELLQLLDRSREESLVAWKRISTPVARSNARKEFQLVIAAHDIS